MTKDEILDLAQDIALVSLDEDTLEQYYEDILAEIGREQSAPLVKATHISLTSGTGDYTIPSDGIEILGLFHIADASEAECRQLSLATLYDLEAYDDNWRTLTGDPWAYLREIKTSRTFQLIPEPDNSTSAWASYTGNPLGADLPDYVCIILYSITRDDGIPDWLALYIVFMILNREFSHASDHQDLPAADTYKAVAEVLWHIGVQRYG